ncbi:helix-turn-helix transcriptional regulator [Chitinophaga tropicalis]|uniref:Helix-turn-helix domain-containing protein n=1 Tax=Chitinophaga tropicalis TaxID=2683588 RepID=A0A7K1U0B9_9BACT|nr:helix-turn-helix transcriptional regulator [Chitinophaga tropicalis]MVT07817.1 helix-turn-helix domain-containing protein [Chitinophaga tropicalis]
MSIKDYNRIKAVLAEKKKTNKELAAYLGKSEQMISKWATNSSQPSVETLYSIAKFLKVGVCELLVTPEIYKLKE